MDGAIKALLWFGIALAIDAILDPAWVNLNYLIHSASYFANWPQITQIAYFHLMPFGISNAIETAIYSLFEGI